MNGPRRNDDADDAVVGALQSRLDALPAPLDPMDASAVDGFLCGVLLQPRAPQARDWLRWIVDVEGRPPPETADTKLVLALAQKRLARLSRAVDARDWFDPWVFEVEGATPSESVAPWVAGFAAAMERFPALTAIEDPRLIEPLALLYRHFDAGDLEDADALLEVIDALEPPADLADAVQDLVAAVMLIADVVRPQVRARTSARQPRRAR